MKKQMLLLLALYCLQTISMNNPEDELKKRGKRVLFANDPNAPKRLKPSSIYWTSFNHNDVNENNLALPHKPSPSAFQEDKNAPETNQNTPFDISFLFESYTESPTQERKTPSSSPCSIKLDEEDERSSNKSNEFPAATSELMYFHWKTKDLITIKLSEEEFKVLGEKTKNIFGLEKK